MLNHIRIWIFCRKLLKIMRQRHQKTLKVAIQTKIFDKVSVYMYKHGYRCYGEVIQQNPSMSKLTITFIYG
jgi:hypothetical protein